MKSTHFYGRSPSIRSLLNTYTDVYGVANYSFVIQESPRDSKDATSNYIDSDPKDKADAIIKHYNHAVKTCKEIRDDLTACWRELGLENQTEFPACFEVIRTRGGSYEVYSERGYPPRIDLDHSQHIPQNVQEACRRLNSAVAASFKYVHSADHVKTATNLGIIKNSLHSPYIESSAEILEEYKNYIDSLRQQCEMFLNDFSVYVERFTSVTA